MSRRSDTRDDFDRVKDSIQTLKAENRKLRKENNQLKKALNRVANREFDTILELEEESTPYYEPIQKEQQNKCPKCRQDALVEVKAGRYLIKVCKDCGYKKRSEVKV